MGQQGPTPGRENVTPVAREEFVRMIDEREAEGIAKYGTTLQTHNGRDAFRDLLEELVDAFQYATQARLECDALRDALRAVLAEVGPCAPDGMGHCVHRGVCRTLPCPYEAGWRALEGAK